MNGTYPGQIPLKNKVNMKKKKNMSRGSPEALARYIHPLPIYKQKYVCIFFRPPIPEKFLLIPIPLQKKIWAEVPQRRWPDMLTPYNI